MTTLFSPFSPTSIPAIPLSPASSLAASSRSRRVVNSAMSAAVPFVHARGNHQQMKSNMQKQMAPSTAQGMITAMFDIFAVGTRPHGGACLVVVVVVVDERGGIEMEESTEVSEKR